MYLDQHLITSTPRKTLTSCLNDKVGYDSLLVDGLEVYSDIIPGVVVDNVLVLVPVDVGGGSRHLLHAALQLYLAAFFYVKLFRCVDFCPRF